MFARRKHGYLKLEMSRTPRYKVGMLGVQFLMIDNNRGMIMGRCGALSGISYGGNLHVRLACDIWLLWVVLSPPNNSLCTKGPTVVRTIPEYPYARKLM